MVCMACHGPDGNGINAGDKVDGTVPCRLENRDSVIRSCSLPVVLKGIKKEETPTSR